MLYFTLITAFLVGAGYLLSHLSARTAHLLGRETAGFGYLVLSSIFGGKILSGTVLPQVTGYLFTGILVGPSFLSIIDRTVLQRLSFVDEIALALIAFAAGAKVDLKELRGNLRDVMGVIAFQILGVVFVYGLFSPVFMKLLGVKGDLFLYVLVFLVLITAAVAKSPATTIAVIMETKAEGRFTDIIVGITVLKDVVIVFMFTVVVALLSAEEGFNLGVFWRLLVELSLSVLVGLLFSVLIIFYFWYFQGGRLSFILIVAFLLASISHHLHFHSIMAAMTSGIMVRNLSPFGHDFLHNLYHASVPILAVFFSVTGASMDLAVVKTILPAALFFVVVRLLSLYLGTRLGARDPQVKKFGWMAFVSQAGLTLGFASLVGSYFKGYGPVLKNLIISTVIMSMVIGPPLFLVSLRKAGDTEASK